MTVSQQFFIYYVFWPLLAGLGFVYIGLMHPGYSPWVFLVGWYLPWLFWPLGTYRRRQMDASISALQAEIEETGESHFFGALAIAAGPLLTMVLASTIGSSLAPMLMDKVLGIDVQARIEEIQASVKREETQVESSEHPESPQVSEGTH